MSEQSDVEELLAQVQAEEAAESDEGQEEAPDAGGPEDDLDDAPIAGDDVDEDDEGELPDADDDEGQEDDEEFEDEPEGEFEDDEEPEEADSEEPSPLQAKLDQMEQDLRALRQERDEQRAATTAQAQQRPRPPAVNPEVVEATRIALFGGSTAGEQLQKFSPEVARLGVEKAREANEMAIMQATDPMAYYHKYLGPTVNAHIRAATSDLNQSNQRRADKAVTDKFEDHLKKPGAMDRVSELLRTMPLSGTYEENLAFAVEVDSARIGTRGRAKKAQREKSRQRDVAAKGTAKKRRGRGRRRSGGRTKAPEHNMDNVMGDVAYLQEQERLGLLKDEH
jgi:hypothetical protein